jgi:hypothetical protein
MRTRGLDKKSRRRKEENGGGMEEKENIRKKRFYILQTPRPGHGYIQNCKFEKGPQSSQV